MPLEAASAPAVHADRLRIAEAAGAQAVRLIRNPVPPLSLMTQGNLDNAVRVLLALGAVFLSGVIFVVLGLVTDGGYALTAGTAAHWLRGHPRLVRSEPWISGGMYIGLGVAAALSSSHRT